MRIVQINVNCGSGSTGKIALSISQMLNERKIENYVLYSAGTSDAPNAIRYTNRAEVKIQALFSRIAGNYGFDAEPATKRLIAYLQRIQPDIVHLHNLHSHDCNLTLLLNYLREKRIRVIWTFHDCWAFTGYCPYFDLAHCDLWKTGCHHCPQYKSFSWFFDKSQWLYNHKKEAMQGLDLTIVTPSQWLADLVKQSFLKDYPVKVINNGIDLNVFKPTKSDFRHKHGLDGKYVVLGVAFGWGKRKGLDVFIELAKRLDDRYRIVLVGTDNEVDKQLPKNILSIHRTENQQQLAEIYTAADVFANPTREENYPTVNMEAIACGTPVVTFKTGGSPEMLDETCGIAVNCDDVDALAKEIVRAQKPNKLISKTLLEKSRSFSGDKCFQKYIALYKDMVDYAKE